MPYLVHVLFKQYYLSNVDAQNQSLFKQCNLSNVKIQNQETFPNQEIKFSKTYL